MPLCIPSSVSILREGDTNDLYIIFVFWGFGGGGGDSENGIDYHGDINGNDSVRPIRLTWAWGTFGSVGHVFPRSARNRFCHC